MKQKLDEMQQRVAIALMGFAHKAKPQTCWHEPDEQEISAEVVGDHLDNACGNYIFEEDSPHPMEIYQEFVVRLRQEREGEEDLTLDINLANLLAIATAGAKEIMGDVQEMQPEDYGLEAPGS